MGEVADLLTGFPFESKKFTREGIKLVRGMNVKRGYLDFSEELCEWWASSLGLESYLLKNGDILIQMDGALIGKSYAKIEENQLPALLVQRVTRARTLEQVADEAFIYQQIQKGFLAYIKGTKTETAVPHLSLSDIENFVISIPSVTEQKKVGSLFESLDNLITLHQKKCFEWKKRGFSSDSISWEQRKLADIVERITRKNENLESTLPLTISAQYGLIDQNEFFDKRIASKDVSGYYLVRKGEFAYNKSTSSDAPWGAIKRLDRYACGVLSTLYIVFRILDEDKVNSDYLVTYYDTDLWHKGVQAIAAEGARNHGLLNIAPVDFFETTVLVPKDIEEQRKIGAYIMRLDYVITLHQRKLERLKRLRNSLVNRCFTGEKYTMSKKILYHGSPNRVIVPKFGFGEDRHDYGRGFYLTENLELAKEWAVCRPDETNGWVHKYELEMDGLNILDFQTYDVLSWLAELMKHRDAADSRRYKMLAQKFIEKYGIDTCGYDVITGWRANASYFYIAKEFVRDNIDIEILEELLSLGGLGIQFCIKSERAFAQLSEVEQDIMSVDYSEFNDRYNERDINARNKMRALVDSDANKVTHVFSTLFER